MPMPIPMPMPMPVPVPVPRSMSIPRSRMLVLLSVPLAGEPERETDLCSRRASLVPTNVEFQNLCGSRCSDALFRCQPVQMTRVRSV